MRHGEGESLALYCESGGSMAPGGWPAQVFVYACGPEGRDGGHVQQLHERAPSALMRRNYRSRVFTRLRGSEEERE